MEYAIVTLKLGEKKYDLELPRYMLIGELEAKVLGLLKQQYPVEFLPIQKLRFLSNGKVLEGKNNLDYYQVCSGAVLEGIVSK